MSSFLKVIDIGLRSALFDKFDDILNLVSINRGVINYPTDIAFRMMSEKKGAMVSEFINMWRVKTAPSWERQRTPVARRGIRVAYTAGSDEMTAITVKAMPVDLEYDVCFWTKNIDNLNLIAERYLFWQHSNPNLQLYYNDDYPIDLDFHFGELIDESNVSDMLDRGNHFRMRVPVRVDGWVFASSDIKVIQKIELVLYDSQNLDEYRECLAEATDYYDADTEIALRLNEEHAFGILAVSIANSSFTINRTSASEFTAGTYLYVDDSTGNDGRYTIVSATDGEDTTVVVVSETIEDETVDGNVSLKNIND